MVRFAHKYSQAFLAVCLSVGVTPRVNRLAENSAEATARALMGLGRVCASNEARNVDGFHSIRINSQWRIVFRWDSNAAHDVQIVDYH